MALELETTAASETNPTPDPIETGSGVETSNEVAPGSPEGLKERFTEAVAKDSDLEAAPVKPEAATAEGEAAKAATTPAAITDLSAHIETLAKEGKPFTFTAEGKQHEVKSAAHHQQLLAQGQKYGTLSRTHSELEKATAKKYGDWDNLCDNSPEFVELTKWQLNDDRLIGLAHRLLTGTATADEKRYVSEGANFVDHNLIKANQTERQLNAITEAQKAEEAAAEEAKTAESNQQLTNTHLEEIGAKYGIKFFDEKRGETPEGRKVFEELKAIVLANRERKPGFDLHDAILRHPKHEEFIAAEKVKAANTRRNTRQGAIRDAEGMSGPTAKPSNTLKPGSPENRQARFAAALRADQKG
jgi:hypothetical protein